MDVSQWVRATMRRVQHNGTSGLRRSMEPATVKLLQFANQFGKDGSSVFSDDWDLLIILDACRYDLLTSVAAEYEYLGRIDPFWSLNSATIGWMNENFADGKHQQKISNTAYVSGNPGSAEHLPANDFGSIDHVWKRAWADPGTVPPSPITNAAIDTHRSNKHEYTVCHYMQPHCPFLLDPDVGPGKVLKKFGNQPQGDIWMALNRGEYDRNTVLKAYKNNLRLVLDDMERLLNNVDAEKVVITSDHGNALGEWGLYGHRVDLPIRCLRMVPWVEASAENTANESIEIETSNHEISRDDQLKSLGYL